MQWVFPLGGTGEEGWEGPEEQHGPSPTPSGSEVETPTLQSGSRLRSASTPAAPPPPHLAVPVEEQGLDQSDDVSAGVVSCTHDGHVQELGAGETLRWADLGEDPRAKGLA